MDNLPKDENTQTGDPNAQGEIFSSDQPQESTQHEETTPNHQ